MLYFIAFELYITKRQPTTAYRIKEIVLRPRHVQYVWLLLGQHLPIDPHHTCSSDPTLLIKTIHNLVVVVVHTNSQPILFHQAPQKADTSIYNSLTTNKPRLHLNIIYLWSPHLISSSSSSLSAGSTCGVRIEMHHHLNHSHEIRRNYNVDDA